MVKTKNKLLFEYGVHQRKKIKLDINFLTYFTLADPDYISITLFHDDRRREWSSWVKFKLEFHGVSRSSCPRASIRGLIMGH